LVGLGMLMVSTRREAIRSDFRILDESVLSKQQD